MGKLIDPERTRKARQAREDRAKKILEIAHEAFTRFPYSEVSLDTLGHKAGLKQGQASLAYRSREELYMAVVLPQLTEWYDTLEAIFGETEDPMTRDEVADVVAATVAERPDLTRLLGPLHMALELHHDGIEVHQFYRWQRERLLELAAAMAMRVPGLHKWEGFDALYRSQLVAAAVHPVSRPVGNLAVDLMAEEHQVFALDLEDEVRRVVLTSLAG
jgi:AcrR family transcriptional regulator